MRVNISDQNYHTQADLTQPAASYSYLRTLLQSSPLHAWYEHPLLGGGSKDSTASMDIGTLVHALLLDTAQDLFVRIDVPDWRTKDAREQRDEAIAAGLIPIKESDYQSALVLAEHATRQILALPHNGWFSPADWWTNRGEVETAFRWEEETSAGPVMVQAKMDCVNEETGIILDLKTTTSASPEATTRKIHQMGYDIQAALYSRCLEHHYPELAGRVQFAFFFIETTPPYAVSASTLSESWLELGRRKVQRGLDAWAKCLKDNKWPGYGSDILMPPAWALIQGMEEANE